MDTCFLHRSQRLEILLDMFMRSNESIIEMREIRAAAPQIRALSSSLAPIIKLNHEVHAQMYLQLMREAVLAQRTKRGAY
jgi:hypothetical protein